MTTSWRLAQEPSASSRKGAITSSEGFRHDTSSPGGSRPMLCCSTPDALLDWYHVRSGMRKGAAMSEANKELVRRHFEEIFDRQNFAVCEGIMAEDYVENASRPSD